MEIIVKSTYNHAYLTSGKDVIKYHTITGDNLQECFKQIDKMERSARYNNHLFYEIIDKDIKQKYSERELSIDDYYGNATVD
jgi:hypothetical protein